MKKRRSQASDYREDYLLNTTQFNPEQQGISVHSFCHSLLLPNFRPGREPSPYILVSLILSGEENYLNADGDRVVRKPGYFSISNLNQAHHPRFRSKLCLERYFVLIRVNRFVNDLLNRLFPAGLPKTLAPAPARLKRCFEDIRRVLRKPGETDDVLLGAMGFRLLSEASNQFSPRPGLPVSLSRAMQYIDNHFCNPSLNRTDIAHAAGISVVSLGKLFRETLRKTMNDHILELRLEKGKHLLEHTGLAISEIAVQCGFSYSYYFIKVFRAHTGCTPRAYRLARRKNPGFSMLSGGKDASESPLPSEK